jgi:hypothetical protein
MLSRLSVIFCLMMATNIWAMPELKTVGQGSYRYVFWQVYDARLATADGTFKDYQHSAPVLLELTYKRDISREQFIDATVDEWIKLGHSNAAQRQAWSERLQGLWRDVTKGDTLSALLQADGAVTFYLNNVETGTLVDADFATAFFDIWLHPKTSAPQLRRQLLAVQ